MSIYLYTLKYMLFENNAKHFVNLMKLYVSLSKAEVREAPFLQHLRHV